MLRRIVLGLVIMIIGGCMIYYSANLVSLFGRSRWAEDHLGGSRQLWMLIGFGLVVVGGLVMFGIVGISNPADVDSVGFN